MSENREHMTEIVLDWRKRNPDKHSATQKRWYEKHKDEVALHWRNYWEANKEILLPRKLEWNKANRDQINAWVRNRRKADPMFRLTNSIRSAIGRSLRQNKDGQHWEDLVGYTLDDLRTHLERKFLSDMTWENYGSDWHVDHVRPVSSFYFTSPDDPDFRECWALPNLQPLWAHENHVKSSKWSGERTA